MEKGRIDKEEGRDQPKKQPIRQTLEIGNEGGRGKEEKKKEEKKEKDKKLELSEEEEGGKGEENRQRVGRGGERVRSVT